MSVKILRPVRRAFGHVLRPYPSDAVPAGSMVELPGRGTTFVTDTGPRDAPAVFLLHSVLTTGLLCWYPSIPALAEKYRVITLDARWHGRGIRSDEFALTDCADDVVALADVLGIEKFTAAGFSMGGGIAQLTWRQHPQRITGLVLCSTGPFFSTSKPEHREKAHRSGRLLQAIDRILPNPSPVKLDDRSAHTTVWAMRQFFSTPIAEMARFGDGLGEFSSRDWLGEIDVPTSVVVSTHDKVVEPERQELLVNAITGARRFDVEGGHACCVLGAERFVPKLVEAVDAVNVRVVEPSSVD